VPRRVASRRVFWVSLHLLHLANVRHETVLLLLILDVLLELCEQLRVLPLWRRRLLVGAPVVDVPVRLVEELRASQLKLRATV
jgi:hypothetical protein